MALKKLGNSITNIAGEIGKTAVNASQKVASNISKIDKDKISETKDNVTENAHKLVEKASSKVKEGANKSTEIVNKVMDVNGDGQVDIEDVIIMGLKVPGICIKREEFLRGEFMKDFPQETIDDAIEFNPAHAGIKQKKLKSMRMKLSSMREIVFQVFQQLYQHLVVLLWRQQFQQILHNIMVIC